MSFYERKGRYQLRSRVRGRSPHPDSSDIDMYEIILPVSADAAGAERYGRVPEML